MSIQATLIGNITSDFELRYGQSGIPVASATIAVNERIFDRQTNEWKDGDTTFVRLSVWREQAEYAAATLYKGMRVVAVGKMKNRPWEDKDGNKRTSLEMQVDEIGPSLKYAVATVTRQQRLGGAPQQPTAYSDHPEDVGDAWATPQEAQAVGVTTGQQVFDEPWATPGAANMAGYRDESTPF